MTEHKPERAPTVDQLRSLAITSPKTARDQILLLFQFPDKVWIDVLTELSAPSDGRLRQLVASTAKSHSKLECFRPTLQAWLKLETDEFAKRAIQNALLPTEPASRRRKSRMTGPLLAETYQYVSARMMHDVRNGLYKPRTQLRRLKRLVAALRDEDVQSELNEALALLDEGLATVGRLVEMQEGDEEYFRLRHIAIRSWLQQLSLRYTTTYAGIGFEIVGDGEVRASDYFLHRIFWNLWVNAHRAIGNSCTIRVLVSTAGRNLLIRVSDNGSGYTAEQAEMMFQVGVAKEAYRGRGLLEVHDAITMLGGSAKPIKDEEGNYRIELRIPGSRK